MNLATTVYPPDTLPLDEWRDHIAQYRSELAFDNGHCDVCHDYGQEVDANDDEIICQHCIDDRRDYDDEDNEIDTGELWDIRHENKFDK